MISRPQRPGGVRRVCLGIAAAAIVAVSGCGGSDGDDDEARTDYYASIDTFCRKVASASERATRDTRAVRQDKSAGRSEAVRVVTRSLRQFADATEIALDDLEQTKPPDDLIVYQTATLKGFRTFVTTLRSTVKAAKKDGTRALRRLGPDLDAVPLPDTPQQITANAKQCARFAPAT